MKTLLTFMTSLMVAGLASAAEPDAQPGTEPSANAQPVTGIPGIQPAASKVERAFAVRLGAHEPIYFIFGPDAPAAKFQFSFKYKILRFGEATPQFLPST